MPCLRRWHALSASAPAAELSRPKSYSTSPHSAVLSSSLLQEKTGAYSSKPCTSFVYPSSSFKKLTPFCRQLAANDLPPLTEEEIAKITRAGSEKHQRVYMEHMDSNTVY